MAKLPAKPPQSLLVSLADKTHNAEAILFDYRVMGDSLWDRFNGGAAGTRWYQRALPFFKTGAAHFANGAADVAEMMRGLVRYLDRAGMSPDAIRNLKPYVVRFVEEAAMSALPRRADIVSTTGHFR